MLNFSGLVASGNSVILFVKVIPLWNNGFYANFYL